MDEQIARFEAPTLSEALEKVRSVYGDNGMILGSRRFKRGGVLGVGGHQVVEVFVADTSSRIANVRRESRSRGSAGVDLDGIEVGGDGIDGDSGRVELGRLEVGLTQLRREIKGLLDRGPEHGTFQHPFLRECYDLLVSREVEPRVADGLVQGIAELRIPSGFPSPARVNGVVRAQLARALPALPPVDPDVRPRIICLIGPTGVGKTTTIAKLAARSKLNERRDVELITLDTYRIAAVDQLQKYAGIIDVPLRVVTSPEDLSTAIRRGREAGRELIFVDSAGRSHRDELKMAELREFLRVMPDAEVHLVLSCTTHSRTMESIAQRFGSIDIDRLILTKADESISLGALLSSLLKMEKPVSFVTDGQNVPDDIMVGDPDRLADLVLKSPTL